MSIKEYKLKENVTINELKNDGFSYSYDCKYLTQILPLIDSIELWIKVYLLDSTFTIEVLDDDFAQYYIPFYRYQDGEIQKFKFLEKVIKKYNCEMDKLNSFVEF